MRKLLLAVAVAMLFGSLGACKKSSNENEAIRAAVVKHLQGRSTLNMAAMDIQVKQVTLNGDQARAEVEFRAKQGGGGMQVAYQLQRTAGNWVVLQSQPMGGELQHPPMDKSHEGALPSGHPPLTDLVKPIEAPIVPSAAPKNSPSAPPAPAKTPPKTPGSAQ